MKKTPAPLAYDAKKDLYSALTDLVFAIQKHFPLWMVKRILSQIETAEAAIARAEIIR